MHVSHRIQPGDRCDLDMAVLGQHVAQKHTQHGASNITEDVINEFRAFWYEQ